LREYELSVIYDLALAEANGDDAGVERLTRVVESHGGAMKGVDHWGRRRMAYPINKVVDGDYIVSRVEVEPGAVSAIEASLRIDESVFRSLVVRADELFEIAPIQERPPREYREPRESRPEASDAAVAAPPATDSPTPADDAPAADTVLVDDALAPAEGPATDVEPEAPTAEAESPTTGPAAPAAEAEAPAAAVADDEDTAGVQTDTEPSEDEPKAEE
jgi:small subunit ribosomal protein S6